MATTRRRMTRTTAWIKGRAARGRKTRARTRRKTWKKTHTSRNEAEDEEEENPPTPEACEGECVLEPFI
eukprot:2457449-Pyramimonas_sp.AAC.1